MGKVWRGLLATVLVAAGMGAGILPAGAAPVISPSPRAELSTGTQSAWSPPASVPAQINPRTYDPAASLAFDATVIVGFQIYQCEPAVSGAGYAWTLTGPQAVLGEGFSPSVYHSYGPRWTDLRDHSSITGVVRAQVSSASVNSIPQLLVTATPDSSAPHGRFSSIGWVQRLDTVGGKPTGTCAVARHGQYTVASYDAHYYFWRR